MTTPTRSSETVTLAARRSPCRPARCAAGTVTCPTSCGPGAAPTSSCPASPPCATWTSCRPTHVPLPSPHPRRGDQMSKSQPQGYQLSAFRTLYDKAAEFVDRKIGWYRLPVPLGLAVLGGLRDLLRSRNLYDTSTLPAGNLPPATPATPEDRPDPPAPRGGSHPTTSASTQTRGWASSQIYGTTREQQQLIRTGQAGKLQVGPDGLPPMPDDPAIDPRIVPGFWLGLLMLQTLFTLEHNSICDRLRAEDPHWSDDEIYQRARLINVALIAKIPTVQRTPPAPTTPRTTSAIP